MDDAKGKKREGCGGSKAWRENSFIIVEILERNNSGLKSKKGG